MPGYKWLSFSHDCITLVRFNRNNCHLPKTVLDNVVVVFTNTSNMLNLSFDIESLSEYFGREVEKYFFIDNPYCQYKRAKEIQNKASANLKQYLKT